jgi:hypothetical protein
MRGAMLSAWAAKYAGRCWDPPTRARANCVALDRVRIADGDPRGAAKRLCKKPHVAPHPVLLPDGEKGPWAAFNPRVDLS